MRKIPEKLQIIHSEFVRYGRNAREWMRKCEMLLPHVDRERIWEKKGFRNIHEYAAKLAGMSHAKVDSVLWTMRKIEGKEEIMKVVKEKGINIVKPIANMLTAENQSFWAEKARTMSMHTLELYAKEFRNVKMAGSNIYDGGQPNGAAHGGASSDGLFESKNKENSFRAEGKVVSMELEIEVVRQLEELKGEEEWNDLMKKFLAMHRAKLEYEKAELEDKKPEAVRTSSRHIPVKIEKYVRMRAKNRCEMPGCARGGKHLHHTIPFSLRREHNPDKIRILCENHHEIAHHGLIENEEMQPEKWQLRKHANSREFRSVIDARVAEYKARSLGKGT